MGAYSLSRTTGRMGTVRDGPCHLVWQVRKIHMLDHATQFDETPARLARQVNKILTRTILRPAQITEFIEGRRI